jgi:fructokinase
MRIGIDLGGTKIEGIALSPGGAELARERISTPRGSYKAIVSAIAGLVASLEQKAGSSGPARVGVGIPGAISPATGLVKNANTTELIGHAFDADLAAALQRQVRLDNDAKCFVRSEATDGAGAGKDVVFGVILGTGAGSGISVGGRTLAGLQCISGEWGHNPLPWVSHAELDEKPACYCGKRGCIEAWVSGPALADDHWRHGGARMSAVAVIEAMKQGEPQAVASYQRYADRLARALAHIVNVLDPDVIILGGGMGKVRSLYKDVPVLMKPYVFSDECWTPIVPPAHGDASGVRGAAWLWPDE